MAIDLGNGFQLDLTFNQVIFYLGVFFLFMTIIEKNAYIFLTFIIVVIMVIMYQYFWGEK